MHICMVAFNIDHKLHSLQKNTIQGAFILSHIAISFSNKWVIFGHLTSNQNQEVQNIRERETCKIDIEKIILPK